jgi:hypothetical protein
MVFALQKLDGRNGTAQVLRRGASRNFDADKPNPGVEAIETVFTT